MNRAHKTKKEQSAEFDATYAELITSPRFSEVKDAAYEAALESPDDSGEVYAVWRSNIDTHLGALATSIVQNNQFEQALWARQKDVAEATLKGEPMGPFSDFVFDLKYGKKSAEADVSEGIRTADVPAAGPDIIASNSKLLSLSNSEPEPLPFLEEALAIMRQRKAQGGRSFEGPGNYATMVKFFSDKQKDLPLESSHEKVQGKKFLREAVGNFLRVSERDSPNIIEIINVLSAAKNMPKHMVDKRYSGPLLRHAVAQLDDFSPQSLSVLIGAIGKLDLEECGDAAAMTLDLAFRKGSRSERSSDLLSALRAVSNLPKSTHSARAFTSMLDTRNNLEVASNLDDLEEINRLLLKVIEYSTDEATDTIRAKHIAEFTARRAVELYKHTEAANKLDIDELAQRHAQVARIIKNARAI